MTKIHELISERTCMPSFTSEKYFKIHFQKEADMPLILFALAGASQDLVESLGDKKRS